MAGIAEGAVQGAARGVLGELGLGGGAGMGLSVGNSSSAGSTSGDAGQGGSGTGDDFAINFGSGVTQGGGVPSWVWMGVAAIAALAIARSKRK